MSLAAVCVKNITSFASKLCQPAELTSKIDKFTVTYVIPQNNCHICELTKALTKQLFYHNILLVTSEKQSI
jgi:hypothetical protein